MASGKIPVSSGVYQRDGAGSFSQEWVIGTYINGVGLVVPSFNRCTLTLTDAKIFTGSWVSINVSGNYYTTATYTQNLIVFRNVSSQGITLDYGKSYLLSITGTYS